MHIWQLPDDNETTYITVLNTLDLGDNSEPKATPCEISKWIFL